MNSGEAAPDFLGEDYYYGDSSSSSSADSSHARHVLLSSYFDGTGLSVGSYAGLVIAGTVSASLSLLGSFGIIYNARSRLDQIYHRLVLGLSISDVVFSTVMIAMPFAGLPETTGYPMAGGTVPSCSAFGFFVRASAMSVVLYNCFLSVYFLLVVKYEWRNEAVARYLEKPAVILALLVPLSFGIAGLVTQSYNPRMFMHVCAYADYPNGCSDPSSDVECERGQQAYSIEYASFGVHAAATIVGVVCSFVVYRTVQGRIRRSREFLERASGSLGLPPPVGGGIAMMNRRVEEKFQMVASQAVLYTLAYLNSAFWPGIVAIVSSFARPTGKEDEPAFYAIQLLARLFFPMQGFFNFFIFVRIRFNRLRKMHPKKSFFRLLWMTVQVSEDNRTRKTAPRGGSCESDNDEVDNSSSASSSDDSSEMAVAEEYDDEERRFPPPPPPPQQLYAIKEEDGDADDQHSSSASDDFFPTLRTSRQ